LYTVYNFATNVTHLLLIHLVFVIHLFLHSKSFIMVHVTLQVL